MTIQYTIEQPVFWITGAVVLIFGLWSVSGTLWRGIRILTFVFVAYTIANQHLTLISGLLNVFVPDVSWRTLSTAVLASTTCVLFITLSILHSILWQPDPVTTEVGWKRIISGFAGASAGWLLSVVIVLGIANAVQTSVNGTIDHNPYMTILLQNAALLNEAVSLLVP